MSFDQRGHMNSQISGARDKVRFWEQRARSHQGGNKPCKDCARSQADGGNGCYVYFDLRSKADPHHDAIANARGRLYRLNQAEEEEGA